MDFKAKGTVPRDIEALARSIHVVFLLAVPLAVLAFGVTWLLRENPLRETAHIGMEAVAGEPVVPEVEERAQEARA